MNRLRWCCRVFDKPSCRSKRQNRAYSSIGQSSGLIITPKESVWLWMDLYVVVSKGAWRSCVPVEANRDKPVLPTNSPSSLHYSLPVLINRLRLGRKCLVHEGVEVLSGILPGSVEGKVALTTELVQGKVVCVPQLRIQMRCSVKYESYPFYIEVLLTCESFVTPEDVAHLSNL